MVFAGAVERLKRLDDAVYDDAIQARRTMVEMSRAAQAVQVAAVAFTALAVYMIARDMLGRQPV